MKQNSIPEAIGIAVSLSGLAVMAGWFLGIEALKSILPVWVSMKFTTALSFFLCGIELYFIARYQKKDRELTVVVIPIICMVIFLLMTSLLVSTVLKVNTGVEELFVKDSMVTVGSVAPGRPSVATMINFILIAASGIVITLNIKELNKLPAILGMTVALIGLTAILGYAINQPWLYYAVTGKSSAIAVHTAILFVLWGAGAVLAERNK